MSIAVSIPLLCAVALAAGATMIGRRVSPKAGAAILPAAALIVAVAADTALAVLIGARLLDVAPLAALLNWRPERAGPNPVPVWLAVAVALALLSIGVSAYGDWRRSRAATRRLRAAQRDGAPGELIVVRSPSMLAYALPGRRNQPGHIVVSDSMLRALDPDERRALLEILTAIKRAGADLILTYSAVEAARSLSDLA